jgi:hypothetical protein
MALGRKLMCAEYLATKGNDDSLVIRVATVFGAIDRERTIRDLSSHFEQRDSEPYSHRADGEYRVGMRSRVSAVGRISVTHRKRQGLPRSSSSHRARHRAYDQHPADFQIALSGRPLLLARWRSRCARQARRSPRLHSGHDYKDRLKETEGDYST